MKIIAPSTFLCLIILCYSNSFSQSKVVSTKGFIFLSESYEKFLDSQKIKDNIDIVYLPDIFFPIKDYDTKSLYKNFLRAEKGICLYDLADRDRLKICAKRFSNLDTSKNLCYRDSFFYLLPVELKYIFFKDPGYGVSCDNPWQFKFENQKINLNLSSADIKIISIKILTSEKG